MNQDNLQPLAAEMRPRALIDFIGQTHLLSPGKPLYEAIRQGRVHSMILWGPPGTGKTTIAKLIAGAAEARIESLSAVMAGVKEIREVMHRAQEARLVNQKTILFVDEVHRFNKSQQDAFLPFVEDGTVTFIGATTENPSFEINNALLSRVRVYVLKPLSESDLMSIIERAIVSLSKGQIFTAEAQQLLAKAADGDARRALNYLEVAFQAAAADDLGEITPDFLQNILSGGSLRRFDKGGDDFYDQISALHKSVRGTDPDAALYWFCRMIDGGCDPLYIARRIVRMATEDIGNADPRALRLALDAWEVYERMGSPEGELALAQAVVYMAIAAKSNAVYVAYQAATRAAKENGSLAVPMHLRNAPTKLMKDLDYGKGYRYAHDEPNAYAQGEVYFPDEMTPQRYYQPVDRGLEIKIKEKLEFLRKSKVK